MKGDIILIFMSEYQSYYNNYISVVGNLYKGGWLMSKLQ